MTTNNPARGRIVPFRQAAERIGVSHASLRRWAADGLITLYRRGPRLLFVDLDELDKLLQPVPTAKIG